MAQSADGSFARRRTDRRLPFAALSIAAALCFSSAASQAAEPPGSAAERDKPPSTDSGSSDNLSERLNRSGGVIKPPENVDPGLQKKPPDDSGKMPVIPPPGSPGGDPNVKPK
jgi:hypothetical protein